MTKNSLLQHFLMAMCLLHYFSFTLSTPPFLLVYSSLSVIIHFKRFFLYSLLFGAASRRPSLEPDKKGKKIKKKNKIK